MIQTVKNKNLDMIKGHFTSIKQGKGSKHSKRNKGINKEFIPPNMRNGLFSGDQPEGTVSTSNLRVASVC